MSTRVDFRATVSRLSRYFVGTGNTWQDELDALRFREFAIGADQLLEDPDPKVLRTLIDQLTSLVQSLPSHLQGSAWTEVSEFVSLGHDLATGESPSVDHDSSQAREPGEDKQPLIFIGHGRSQVWLQLQVFLTNRLKLEWRDFDRNEAAGDWVVQHILDILEQSSFAFLILTGEDRDEAGNLRPRQNVIHELGLCQGRLGLRKAIPLVEEGCSTPSNMDGLKRIVFPQGNLGARSDAIRAVLEREDVIKRSVAKVEASRRVP